MRTALTVASQHDALLRLVREFAEGLGWTSESAVPSSISLLQPEDAAHGPDDLLNLLTYVALSAMKTGVDSGEPVCRIRYRREQASEVTLGVRIVEFDLGS